MNNVKFMTNKKTKNKSENVHKNLENNAFVFWKFSAPLTTVR